MPLWKLAILILTILALGWGFFALRSERANLDTEAKTLKADVSAIQEKNAGTEEKINYFKDPENLLKEAKSQFNYRAPGEELIIIVPEKEE